MYVSNEDRITKRKVTDAMVNEEFQEALKYDPSLMIEEHPHKIIKGVFKKRVEDRTQYSIYHETPAHDGTAYQARLQGSGSGEKKIVIAYLHGIINGVIHRELKTGSNAV